MLKGFATISYYATDLDAAEKWYSDFLGAEAYFHVPGYVEFRIGDFAHELGIIDARYAPHDIKQIGGVIMQWHVDDLEATLGRLLSLGATEYQPVTDRGHGFRTAAVVDPFGNVLGIMYNPHYVQVVDRLKPEKASLSALED